MICTRLLTIGISFSLMLVLLTSFGIPLAALLVLWTLPWTSANPFAGLLSLWTAGCFVRLPLPRFMLLVTLGHIRTSLAGLATTRLWIALNRYLTYGLSCAGVCLPIASSFRSSFRWRGPGPHGVSIVHVSGCHFTSLRAGVMRALKVNRVGMSKPTMKGD